VFDGLEQYAKDNKNRWQPTPTREAVFIIWGEGYERRPDLADLKRQLADTNKKLSHAVAMQGVGQVGMTAKTREIADRADALEGANPRDRTPGARGGS